MRVCLKFFLCVPAALPFVYILCTVTQCRAYELCTVRARLPFVFFHIILQAYKLGIDFFSFLKIVYAYVDCV